MIRICGEGSGSLAKDFVVFNGCDWNIHLKVIKTHFQVKAEEITKSFITFMKLLCT